MNVGFIGHGRMGTAQARIARHFGDSICWGMDLCETAQLHFKQTFDVPVYHTFAAIDFSKTDVIWITVTDGQIERVAGEISSFAAPSTVVLHTSGSMDYTAIKKSLPNCACASYHPLLPCPLAEVSDFECVSAYRGVIHAVDGDEKAVNYADLLVDRIQAKRVQLKSGQKARYHAAAVLASNYPIVLLDMASEMFVQCGFEPGDAAEAAKKLCAQCLQSASKVSFSDALTGPVKRNDQITIAKHEAILADSPMILDVYECLKNAAFSMLNRSH